MSIFKQCDIRGVYGVDLDEAVAARLGRVVASMYPGQEIVVGGDVRLSTPALKAALIEGLMRSGARVTDVGLVPTPVLYYAKRLCAFSGGVMVTASHNPARYNGFKLMLGDLPVTPDGLRSLAERMAAGGFLECQGTLGQRDVLPEYADSLCRRFPALSTRTIVVDAGHGSMGAVAPQVLERVGQHVESLYCEMDGAFPLRDPNPAVPEHLVALRRRVLAVGADLGVGYDGDGDRVIFVDERGRVLPADRTLVLLLRHVLASSTGGGVVYDLKSSSIVMEETLAAGGRPLMERSGHAFIKRRLIAEGAILGGEISGHYFFGELGGDDALYATLMLLEVLDHLDMTLGQAIDTVPDYPITPDLRLPCPPDVAERILDELLDAFADMPIGRIDGVRVEFPSGWGLARLSVTEPLLTLRFEAHTEDQLARIQDRFVGGSPLLARLFRDAAAWAEN